jgi:peroxiredoxin
MLKGWTRLAVAAGLFALITPTGRAHGAAAQAGLCDARAERADLDFTLKDIQGKDVTLSDYRGRVILLNFWATWCGPCRIEIPGFVELYKTYRSRGLIVLGVSADDPVATLKPFAAQMKMDYPVLVGNGRDDVQKAFPWEGLPKTFIIGRDGTICHEHSGLATKNQIEPIIKSLM